MGLLTRKKLGLKPEELELLRKRSDKVPRIYVVNEPPLTFKAGEKEYECKDILQTPQGVICVQYDNTMVYVTPHQQTQQQPLAPSAGVALV